MKPRAFFLATLCLLVLAAFAQQRRLFRNSYHPAASAWVSNPVGPGLDNSCGKLPPSFEANQGQTDSRVRFLSRGSGYTLFLTPTEAVLSLHKSHRLVYSDPKMLPTMSESVSPEMPASGSRQLSDANSAAVRLRLAGANSAPHISGLEELPGRSNYFIGNDPKKWRRNLPSYARVRYDNVYPGVDLVYYGNQRQLEYDFIVGTRADPSSIRLAIAGVEKLEPGADGGLVLHCCFLVR